MAATRRWTTRGAAATALLALTMVAACVPDPPSPPRTTTTSTTTSTTLPGESNVATLLIGDDTVTVEGPQGSSVTATLADSSDVPPAPSNLSFPFGALAIRVDGVAPGSVVPVEVSFTSPVDVVRKLILGEWREFLNDGVTGAVLATDGLSISLRLQDGGRGDSDGAADGSVSDPLAPAVAESLTITTTETPVIRPGEPYEFQLEAAGAEGDVEWSLLWSAVNGRSAGLPAGMMLDTNGVISASGDPQHLLASMLLQVQASDGVTTTTKLVPLMAFSQWPEAASSTGAPLPDGQRMLAMSSSLSSSSFSFGWLNVDGSLSPVDRVSFALMAEGDGSQVVDASLLGATGTFDVRDAESGQVLQTVTTPWTAGDGSGVSSAFSPDGSHVVFVEVDSGRALAYDATTWTLVRNVTVPVDPDLGYFYPRVVWSPASDEFILDGDGRLGSIVVHSASDSSGVSDRTLPLSAAWHVLDWSTTSRLALSTGSGGVVTAFAGDGQDVRHVASDAIYARFSPSGTHLAITRSDLGTSDGGRLAVVADADAAELAYLTVPPPPYPQTIWVVAQLWR